VHIKIASHAMIFVAEPRHAPQVGDEVDIRCDAGDIYVFDPEDGRLLVHGI
jgi:hypothetical protein